MIRISFAAEPDMLHRDFRVCATAALATLPETFSVVPEACPAGVVVALDGRGEWARDADTAIAGGALGVWVCEPRLQPVGVVESLRETARASGTPVRLARRWACSPAARLLAQRRTPGRFGVLVEGRAVVPERTLLSQLLIDQVDLVHSALTGRVEIGQFEATETAYIASGFFVRTGTATPLILSGLCGAGELTPTAVVRELREGGRVAIEISDARSARAAAVSIGHRDGEMLLHVPYETAHRVSLRELSTDIAACREEAPDLSDFVAALSAAAGALPHLR